jgi:3-hydroxyisobutyrate dehydrogenase-like beta-hydroxyacid dehydrogenase
LIDGYVDWLWFGELGYRAVFTTVLLTRLVLFLVVGLLVGGIVFGGLALAYRTRPVFVPSNGNDPVARYRSVVMSRLRVIGTGVPVAIGVLASLTPGATHISSSTISVDLSRRLTAAHGATGQHYVAAPVFGRPEAANAAKLFVIAGGAPERLEALAPVFDAIAQRTFVVSEQQHAANLVKLSGNFLIASVIESLGEVIALVGKAGVDPQQYVDILTSTLFSAPVYQTYGGLIARQEFEPAGFAAALGLKDVRLALAAAEELSVPLPIASLLRDRFLALLANGGGDLDWSAIATLAGRDAGSHHSA